jgi:hypothetical protein
MNKKLFALTSVAALAGLVATTTGVGCTVPTASPLPGADAGSADSGLKTPSKDGGKVVVKDEDGDEEDRTPACFKKDPFDGKKGTYTKAGVNPGACSTKELADWATALKDLLDAKKLTEEALVGRGLADDEAFLGLKDGLSATCAACVYTEDGATAWGVFPKNSNRFYNLAGCYERYSNKACGEASYQYSICVDTACKDCNSEDRQACASAAIGEPTLGIEGPCTEEFAAFGSACKENSSIAVQNCILRTKREDGSAVVFRGIEGTWIALCGGTKPFDAGAGDGGP